VGVLLGTLVPLLYDQARALIEAAPGLVERLSHHRAIEWADEKFGLIASVKEELSTRGAGAAAAPIVGVVKSLVVVWAAFVTIAVLTAFMLLFGRDLLSKGLNWVEPHKRDRYRMLARRIHLRVGGYVAGSLTIATIGGVVTAISLIALGVPYFLPLGLAMIVLGVIPFLGPWLGAVLVVGTTLAAAGLQRGVIAFVIFLVYQQVENHLLQPLIQRRTISMNPLIIAMVMLIATALLGVLGTLLALPFAGAVQVILQDVQERRRERWARQQAETDEDAGTLTVIDDSRPLQH
jgi:predicted PurR-regulated permease PerM